LDSDQHDPSHQLSPGRRSTGSKARVNIRRDRWIASRIGALVEKSEPAQLETIERLVDEYLKTVPTANAVEKHDLLRLFPRSAIASETALALAQALMLENELLRARRLLEPMLKSDDLKVAARATHQMAIIYATANLPARAANFVETLEANFATTIVSGSANNFASNSGSDSGSDSQYGSQAAAELARQFRLTQAIRPIVTQSKYTHANTIDVKRDNGAGVRLAATEVELTSTDDPELSKFRFLYYGQTGELEVLDFNGQPVFRFQLRQTRTGTVDPISSTMFGAIKAHQDVLLLTVASELFAIDWLKLNQGLQPVLWNIAIDAPEREKLPTVVSHLWGERDLGLIKGFNDRNVFSGTPVNQGTCYVDGSNLVCIDTHSGRPCWQRTNFPTRSTVFGDDQNVVVWPPSGRKATIVDVASGQQVKQLELDVKIGSIWATQGTKLLLSFPHSTSGTIVNVLGLYDLLEETFIWQQQFAPKTRGCLTSDHRLCVFKRNGDLEFVDLRNGEVAMKSKVNLPSELLKTIDGIGISKRRGQYLIHLTTGDVPTRYEMYSGRAQIRNIIPNLPFLQGYLLAIDSMSGDPAWSKPIRFRGWQAAMRNPEASPVHMLVRRFDRDNEEGRRRASMQIVLIDLDNGRKLLNYTFDEYYRVSYRLQWKPKSNELRMEFPERILRMNLLAASDFPPTPLASLTDESTIPLLPFKISAVKVAPSIIASEIEQIKQAAQLEASQIESLRKEETMRLQQEK
jgi:hypothetical protein